MVPARVPAGALRNSSAADAGAGAQRTRAGTEFSPVTVLDLEVLQVSQSQSRLNLASLAFPPSGGSIPQSLAGSSIHGFSLRVFPRLSRLSPRLSHAHGESILTERKACRENRFL